MNELIEAIKENPKLYGFAFGILITLLFYLFKEKMFSFSIPSKKQSSYNCERAGRNNTSDY